MPVSEESEGRSAAPGLRRRAFLGGAAGAAAVGVSGCAGLSRAFGTGQGALSRAALEEHLLRLDDLLEAAGGVDFVSDFVRERGSGLQGGLEGSLGLADAHAQRAVRTLTLTSMVLDLPEEVRGAPAVQERIERLGPEMDDALLRTADLLAACPRDELDDVEAALRDDPMLAMRVCELVDHRGREHGLGHAGRRRLRALGRSVTNCLRDRSLSTLVEECQRAVAVAEARHGTVLDEEERRRLETESLAIWAPVAGDAWAKDKSPEQGGGAARPRREPLPCFEQTSDGYTISTRCAPPPVEEPPAERTPPAEATDDEALAELEYQRWRRNRGGHGAGGESGGEAEARDTRLVRAGVSTLSIGATMMAIGGGTFVLEEIIGGVFMTLGGIILIVGIILLAVGASRRAARRRGEL